MLLNLLKRPLQKLIKTEVDKVINDLLHPTVEIVSLDNAIPKYATPGDAGADILMGNLSRIQTKFMKGAYIVTYKSKLYAQLDDALAANDTDKVNEINRLIDTAETKVDFPYELHIKPGGHCLVPTGIFTSFPDNYVADIIPKSGLALKKRITITNSPGKVDARYKNEWGIIVDNESDEDFILRQGDYVCQVQFSLKCQAQFVQKESVEDLSGTDRGGGFGAHSHNV